MRCHIEESFFAHTYLYVDTMAMANPEPIQVAWCTLEVGTTVKVRKESGTITYQWNARFHCAYLLCHHVEHMN